MVGKNRQYLQSRLGSKVLSLPLMIYHFEDCNKQFFRIISDETSIKLETAYKILEILQVKPQEIVDFFRQKTR